MGKCTLPWFPAWLSNPGFPYAKGDVGGPSSLGKYPREGAVAAARKLDFLVGSIEIETL